MAADGLHLVDLDQPLPGQRRFISCWVSRQSGLTFIVDPGPASTADHLVASLRELGVTWLDFILLTHVHLDHAGAAARVLEAFPDARVSCHPAGVPHLVDPARLWDASRAVLREAAEVYGRPLPLPAEAVAAPAELERARITAIETPGHAAHHVAYLNEGTLFVGEAAGTFAALDEGEDYLRPATPPRFHLEAALSSLERLLALEPEPERLAYGHYGLAEGRSRTLLRAALDQHRLWIKVAREEGARGWPDWETLLEKTAERLRAEDPWSGRFARLEADVQTRERLFTRQTLTGMFEYLDIRY